MYLFVALYSFNGTVNRSDDDLMNNTLERKWKEVSWSNLQYPVFA